MGRYQLFSGVCLSLLLVPISYANVEVLDEASGIEAAPEMMMETIVVTATRENKEKWELAESISVLNGSEIEKLTPSHPAEALNRVAGVHINNLGGEGHMSAIR